MASSLNLDGSVAKNTIQLHLASGYIDVEQIPLAANAQGWNESCKRMCFITFMESPSATARALVEDILGSPLQSYIAQQSYMCLLTRQQVHQIAELKEVFRVSDMPLNNKIQQSLQNVIDATNDGDDNNVVSLMVTLGADKSRENSDMMNIVSMCTNTLESLNIDYELLNDYKLTRFVVQVPARRARDAAMKIASVCEVQWIEQRGSVKLLTTQNPTQNTEAKMSQINL